MPPKKGGKGDKKKDKKKDDEPEWDGPNIYKELIEKDVTEILVDLTAPIKIIEKENTEF